MPARSPQHKEDRAQASAPAPEVVDPVWLLKAFGVSVLVALLCAYLTLCGLFYRGQWQLVLHPVRTFAPPASVGGVAFQLVKFGAGATGTPQLTGWWIPAASGAAFAHITVLYLPSGEGSLTSDQATLASLHDAGVAIFAVDYRGYGQSAEAHPNQASMTEDSESAWQYLTGSRGIPAERVIPYGVGVGGALALSLASSHPAIPALILDAPDFGVVERVRRDSRSRLVPVGLLFHDRFALLPLLDELHTPKLILSREDREDTAALTAADPKMTVAIPSTAASSYGPTLKRFLDQYAPPSPPSELVLTPALSPRKTK